MTAFLKNTDAIREMTEIADPGKFYKVSNYAALDDILSSLEQNLIGIEGRMFSANFSLCNREGFVDSSHAEI